MYIVCPTLRSPSNVNKLHFNWPGPGDNWTALFSSLSPRWTRSNCGFYQEMPSSIVCWLASDDPNILSMTLVNQRVSQLPLVHWFDRLVGGEQKRKPQELLDIMFNHSEFNWNERSHPSFYSVRWFIQSVDRFSVAECVYQLYHFVVWEKKEKGDGDSFVVRSSSIKIILRLPSV